MNAVLPGNILTEGVEALGPEYIARMTSAIPQKRLGSVEDIAYAALFLASDEAGFIPGKPSWWMEGRCCRSRIWRWKIFRIEVRLLTRAVQNGDCTC